MIGHTYKDVIKDDYFKVIREDPDERGTLDIYDGADLLIVQEATDSNGSWISWEELKQREQNEEVLDVTPVEALLPAVDDSVPEYVEVVYEVALLIREDADGIPTAEEIQKALYRGIDLIDTEDAVSVTRT